MNRLMISFFSGLLVPFLNLILFGVDEDLLITSSSNIMPIINNQIFDGASHTKIGAINVRLLCWVMTDPNVSFTVIPVKNTWWKLCDQKIFFSSKTDPDLPAVGLMVPPGRDHIAEKSRNAWSYIGKNYIAKADFFLKADPDSFINIQNLKQFLHKRSPNAPEFYGHMLKYIDPYFKTYFDGRYAAGQAIVLTREALRRLTEGGINTDCFSDGQGEDLKTAACLSRAKVHLVDTRDIFSARETFFPPLPIYEIITNGYIPDWYNKFRSDMPVCTNISCLSDKPIVFHYTEASQFYILDYFFNLQNSVEWYAEEKYDDRKYTFNGTKFKLSQ